MADSLAQQDFVVDAVEQRGMWDERKYSEWPCPRCGQERQVRRHLPLYWRPLRQFRFDVRAYRCTACSGHSVRVQRRSRWTLT